MLAGGNRGDVKSAGLDDHRNGERPQHCSGALAVLEHGTLPDHADIPDEAAANLQSAATKSQIARISR